MDIVVRMIAAAVLLLTIAASASAAPPDYAEPTTGNPSLPVFAIPAIYRVESNFKVRLNQIIRVFYCTTVSTEGGCLGGDFQDWKATSIREAGVLRNYYNYNTQGMSKGSFVGSYPMGGGSGIGGSIFMFANMAVHYEQICFLAGKRISCDQYTEFP